VLIFAGRLLNENRHALLGSPGVHAMRSAEAMRHLTIVVPFREREAHLERFVPHVKAFFTWHKVHRDIPYRVLIVEEEREIASTFDGERPARWEMVCVRIDTVPSPAHLEALGLPVANRP
jgi:hypothetical protein